MVRGDSPIEISVIPNAVVEEGRTVGKIGLGAALGDGSGFPESMRVVERYGPLAALGPAARETWQKSALTVRFLSRP